ncbi:MAG: D-ribose pyranase [Lacisediminihabitans sp.]
MRKHGILNAQLAAAISRLGHTDTIVVADCGLPVPVGVEVVDLAVVFGVPRFTQVLDALLADCLFEACTAASEARGTVAGDFIAARFPGALYVTHEELKRRSSEAKLIVRTGEATPFANVLLRCGVPF